MSHQLLIEGCAVTVVAIQKILVRDALDEHSRMEAWVTFAENRTEVLKCIGCRIRWKHDGKHQPQLFSGFVMAIDYGEDVVHLSANGDSIKFDLRRRTRSFSSADGSPQPISELEGFRDAFGQICGEINQLQLRLSSITQFEETDWEFLCTLAHKCGKYLRWYEDKVHIGNGGQAVTTVATKDLRCEVLQLHLGLDRNESLTWDWRAGLRPSEPVKANLSASPHSSDSHCVEAANQLVGSQAAHSNFQNGLPGAWSDAQNSQTLSKVERAGLFSWQADVVNLDLVPGTELKVSDSNDVKDTLLVVIRDLSFDSKSHVGQIVNRVECIRSGLLPSTVRKTRSPSGARQFFGQVVDVADQSGLALLKVLLPWHTGKRDAIWSQAPQPSAGKTHGVVNLPALSDWVVVLFDSNSVTPPVILGSVYQGSSKVPSFLTLPDKQRLLLLTDSGHRIFADDAANTLNVAICTEDDAVCSIQLTKQPASILLKAKNGTLVLDAKSIEITAQDGVSIKGKLSVTAPKGT